MVQMTLDAIQFSQEVVDHLLAERENASEQAAYLDRLLELATLEMAEHQALRDPFDRSVALVFGLIHEADMDPWSIDLAGFARLFEARLAGAEGIDLPACGRLLRMAWQVLHGQAEQLLHRTTLAEEEVFDDDLWFDDGGWEQSADDETYEFNLNIISGRARPHLPDLLAETVRRGAGRTVTLSELLAGLADAHEEAEGRKRREAARERWREDVEHALSNVTARVHAEDLEADVAQVWHALRRRAAHADGGAPVTFDAIIDHVVGELAQEAPDESPETLRQEARITAFVALLFLARRGLAEVWQSSPGEGDVQARDLWPQAPDYTAAVNAAKQEQASMGVTPESSEDEPPEATT